MGLFNTKTPNETAETVANEPPRRLEGLPAGFDDQKSWFFIPEHLREHYDNRNGEEARITNLDDAMRSHAWGFARQQAYEEIPAPPAPTPTLREPSGRPIAWVSNGAQQQHSTKIADRAQELADGLLASRHSELIQYSLHHLHLTAAEQRYKSKVSLAKSKADHERIFTCPVCGQYNPQRNGRIEERSVLPSLSVVWTTPADKTAPRIRSCVPCHVIAVEEYAAMLAAEIGPDFQHPTRRAAVRAALALDGRPASTE